MLRSMLEQNGESCWCRRGASNAENWFFILASGVILLAGCAASLERPSIVVAPPLVQINLDDLPAAQNPHAAHQQRILQWQDENGVIAKGGLMKALPQRNANMAANRARDLGIEGDEGGGDEIVGTQGMDWIQRGPDNIGGRTRALLIDPRNTNRMWAGGVFRAGYGRHVRDAALLPVCGAK